MFHSLNTNNHANSSQDHPCSKWVQMGPIVGQAKLPRLSWLQGYCFFLSWNGEQTVPYVLLIKTNRTTVLHQNNNKKLKQVEKPTSFNSSAPRLLFVIDFWGHFQHSGPKVVKIFNLSSFFFKKI